MPKKFDTNPLDPEFPDKVKAQTASVGDYTSPNSPYKTSEFPTSPSSVTEETTRRLAEEQFEAYQFMGGPAPVAYQAAGVPDVGETSERIVAKTGTPERWLIGLPYIPFTIGLIAGLILLLIMPKTESRVRFHAAQGLAAHVGVLIVTTLLSIVGKVTDLAQLGNGIFTVATTVLLLIFAIKAWRGKPVHIESIDDLTNWLEEKIGPIK